MSSNINSLTISNNTDSYTHEQEYLLVLMSNNIYTHACMSYNIYTYPRRLNMFYYNVGFLLNSFSRPCITYTLAPSEQRNRKQLYIRRNNQGLLLFTNLPILSISPSKVRPPQLLLYTGADN